MGRVPILGVCLGHQMLGFVSGSRIIRSKSPRHGHVRKVSIVLPCDGLNNLPQQFMAAAYNSLVIDKNTLDRRFKVVATCENHEVQAIEYSPEDGFLSLGVQYHPESFLSEAQDFLRLNWVNEVKRYYGMKLKDCNVLPTNAGDETSFEL